MNWFWSPEFTEFLKNLPNGFWLTWGVQIFAATVTFTAVLVAIFGESIRGWFYSPKLTLIYKNNPRKYIISTKDAVTLRVAVWNKGHSTAKSVRVLTPGLVLQTIVGGEVTFTSDVLTFTFAKIDDLAVDIPRDTRRFVNICRIVPPNIGQELIFAFHDTPGYFPGSDKTATPKNDLIEGHYSVTLQLTADNCATREESISFEWDGKNQIRFVEGVNVRIVDD